MPTLGKRFAFHAYCRCGGCAVFMYPLPKNYNEASDD